MNPHPDMPRRWTRIRLAHAALVVLSASVAIGLSVAGSPNAWIPLMVLTATLCAGAMLHIGWWRAIHRAAKADSEEDRAARVRGVGMRTVAHIMLALIYGALFVTLIVVELEHALAAFFATFCALAIFGGPVWLASVGDEESEEREELDRAAHERPRRT
jgi:hypothetical protein